ncbi:hypothetical protein F503_04283 [Ophiostoma piceae UAMH 11346]|uniref:Uncharacterized protein n=1 Tax=Ophiostoma piceae (strain UAMH 11346) TaxID=1262450 RepID=S3C9W6_OPHP1|nr:hypothetical protein F503_04283 [Ophiostoma piceae UAMH 11346]
MRENRSPGCLGSFFLPRLLALRAGSGGNGGNLGSFDATRLGEAWPTIVAEVSEPFFSGEARRSLVFLSFLDFLASESLSEESDELLSLLLSLPDSGRGTLAAFSTSESASLSESLSDDESLSEEDEDEESSEEEEESSDEDSSDEELSSELLLLLLFESEDDSASDEDEEESSFLVSLAFFCLRLSSSEESLSEAEESDDEEPESDELLDDTDALRLRGLGAATGTGEAFLALTVALDASASLSLSLSEEEEEDELLLLLLEESLSESASFMSTSPDSSFLPLASRCCLKASWASGKSFLDRKVSTRSSSCGAGEATSAALDEAFLGVLLLSFLETFLDSFLEILSLLPIVLDFEAVAEEDVIDVDVDATAGFENSQAGGPPDMEDESWGETKKMKSRERRQVRQD